VNYVGYLAATGAVFDQNMQTPMSVGGVIPGFSEGLQRLSRTGIVRLRIPERRRRTRSRQIPTSSSRSS
jgi:FKBP-type peptidyl-prolyl cis-trans isomerase FkpA